MLHRRSRSYVASALARCRPRARRRARDPGTGDWPMWGGTPDRNMVSNMKGLPTEWDVKTKKNVKWVADLGSQSYGNPVVAGGMVFVGTNNEIAARSEAARRSRRADGVQAKTTGEFLWQQTHEKLASGRANDWPYQGVAVVAARRRQPPLLHEQSRRRVVPRHQRLPRRQERRAGHRREADRPERRRRHLVVRHDGGSRRLSAQHVELVAGHLGRPGVRQHVERAGRKPRAHSVAEGAGDHRAQQEHRQAGVGGQLGRGPHPARPVVDAVGRQDRRRRSGGQRAGRRLGARLRSRDRQEAVGVRHQPEGLGLAEDAQRGDRHAGDLRGPASTSPTARIRSTAKASATSTASTPPSAATSRRPAASGTTTRSAARFPPPSIADGLLYIPDFSGFLHCLDAKTGQVYWTHDMFAAVWGSTLVVDGKVYLGDEDGDVVILQAGKEKKVHRRDEHGQRGLRDARCRRTARCS